MCPLTLQMCKQLMSIFSFTRFFALIVTLCSLISGCSTAVERLNKLQEQNRKTIRHEVNALLSEPGDINRISPKKALTPLLAASFFDPERIPDMIAQGADVNYRTPFDEAALHILMYREAVYKGIFWAGAGYGPYDDTYELAATEALLQAGANPNIKGLGGATPAHFAANPQYYKGDDEHWLDMQVERIALIVRYGADLSIGNAEGLTPYESSIPANSWARENQTPSQEAFSQFLFLAEKHGIEQAYAAHIKRKTSLAKEAKEKARAEAERKHREEIAWKRKQAQKQAISSYIASHPDLNNALAEVVQIGREKKAVDSVLRENAFGKRCETGSNNTYFQSKTCISGWKTLKASAESHYSSLDSAYRKQRDWFSNLFGKSGGIVKELVDDRIGKASADDAVKQQYAPALRQLSSITAAEARAERAEMRRQEQQRMADFMNNIQNSFERTNQMLDRNMAQTQQVIHQAYASQRANESGYQSSSRYGMPELSDKLKDIDRRFDASATSESNIHAPENNKQKSGHRVCAGPFTMPAIDMVVTTQEYNGGRASQKFKCPENTIPVQEGAHSAQFTNWLLPNRTEEPAGKGNIRITRKAFRYECLCANDKKTGSSSTQQ